MVKIVWCEPVTQRMVGLLLRKVVTVSTSLTRRMRMMTLVWWLPLTWY